MVTTLSIIHTQTSMTCSFIEHIQKVNSIECSVRNCLILPCVHSFHITCPGKYATVRIPSQPTVPFSLMVVNFNFGNLAWFDSYISVTEYLVKCDISGTEATIFACLTDDVGNMSVTLKMVWIFRQF